MKKNIEDNDFLKYVLFTEETTFILGVVCLHTTYTLNENPHVVQQSHRQHRFSVNVWASISGNNVVGP